MTEQQARALLLMTDRLIRISKEAALLESCSRLFHWDQETFMPEAGNTLRAYLREKYGSLYGF